MLKLKCNNCDGDFALKDEHTTIDLDLFKEHLWAAVKVTCPYCKTTSSRSTHYFSNFEGVFR